MLSKSTDIIITTFNRAEKVQELVSQLLAIVRNYAKIIVVDSSDIINTKLKQRNEICYLRSSHKNQPYQRYLGFLEAKSEVLIFLDDDMEIVDNKFMVKTLKLFDSPEVVGLAIKFEDKVKETSLSQIPASNLFRKNRLLKDIKGWLTGYPRLRPGEFGLCGNKGPQPRGGGITEWISGGAFAARYSAIFQNFNFQLFDIFENHLGMGEDSIIGYGLSKQGKVIYLDELFFLHNDQKDSTYSLIIQSFTRKVAFSRLFLSFEKKRLDERPFLIAYVHYHYYMFWRILGCLGNIILERDKSWQEVLKGNIQGWAIASFYRFTKSDKAELFWKYEAKNDSIKYVTN